MHADRRPETAQFGAFLRLQRYAGDASQTANARHAPAFLCSQGSQYRFPAIPCRPVRSPFRAMNDAFVIEKASNLRNLAAAFPVVSGSENNVPWQRKRMSVAANVRISRRRK
jgi:hypothetical protein